MRAAASPCKLPIWRVGVSACGSSAGGPDGKKLVFTSGVRPAHLYTINVDGTGLRKLTRRAGRYDAPALSPRGDRVAFFSDRTGSHELYVMNTDGTNQVRLTSGVSLKP